MFDLSVCKLPNACRVPRVFGVYEAWQTRLLEPIMHCSDVCPLKKGLPHTTHNIAQRRQLLHVMCMSCPAAAGCTVSPPQQAHAMSWSNCNAALQSTCSADCSPGATGAGFKAVCTTLQGGMPSWEVAGSCVPGGSTGEYQRASAQLSHACAYALVKCIRLLDCT